MLAVRIKNVMRRHVLFVGKYEQDSMHLDMNRDASSQNLGVVHYLSYC